ncbi:MAG: hypothetical protein CMM87_02605 [Rickettsiales bacterium]|nr:hypothetical protein [Rickettsiales bacterium]|tara:strand:- start:33459 stop:34562 length:1104 start_codon:yes stop_codon:yes gene_type:complete
MRSVTVAKFGGSSLSTAAGIKRCLNLIKTQEYQVVVVSANGKMTQNLDLLVLYHRQSNTQAFGQIWAKITSFYDAILTELSLNSIKTSRFLTLLMALKDEFNNQEGSSDAFRDRILAYGEYLSAGLLNELADFHFVPATQLIRTNNMYGAAEPDAPAIRKNVDVLINEHDFSKKPLLTQGFVGCDDDGNATTLGFEGSDFSAALLSEAFEAESLTIWTDVAGIYTGDPRYIQHALGIDQMSYAFAERICQYGARVLHPRTLEPLKRANIPLNVRSTLESNKPGTLITNQGVDSMPVITSQVSKIWLHHFDAETLEHLQQFHPIKIVSITEPFSLAIIETQNAVSQIELMQQIHECWLVMQKEKKYAR